MNVIFILLQSIICRKIEAASKIEVYGVKVCIKPTRFYQYPLSHQWAMSIQNSAADFN